MISVVLFLVMLAAGTAGPAADIAGEILTTTWTAASGPWASHG